MKSNDRNVRITQERLEEILINAYIIGTLNEKITLKEILDYLENQLKN